MLFDKLLNALRLKDDNENTVTKSATVWSSGFSEQNIILDSTDIIPELKPEPILNDVSSELQDSYEENFPLENPLEELPYKSGRFLISGLHLLFIDVAREIVACGKVNLIPLMREYGLSEAEVFKILDEMQQAKIINSSHKVLINPLEKEVFIRDSWRYC